MKENYTLRILSVICFLLVSLTAWSQKIRPLEIAKHHIEENYASWGLLEADISDLEISDHYQTQHNGLTHLYFKQRYQGIEIYNAILGVHVTVHGRPINISHRLFSELSNRVNSVQPIMSAHDAIEAATLHLGISADVALKLLSQQGNRQYLFERGYISRHDIPVKLCFLPVPDGELRLAWDIEIDDPYGIDYWSIRVDALTGEVLDKSSYTAKCTFGENPFGAAEIACDQGHSGLNLFTFGNSSNDGANYTVFAQPVESPVFGDRSTISSPADIKGSPFGWHDTDGLAGPEYTTTRGNNVNAILARKANSSPSGNEPDGGEGLRFDFPYDPDAEPFFNAKAATTNLFYMTNIMHDFSYHYGFDEEAGNFQEKNYSASGKDADGILAMAQYGAEIPSTPNDNNLDNDYINNANFSTAPDGGVGRLRMFVWDRGLARGKLLNVNAPATIAGLIETASGNFGTAVSANAVTGQVALVDDGTSSGSLGCNDLVNGNEIDGKIALIDRGSCDFSWKVLKAQQAGAIGAIICNFEDALIGGMAGGDGADQVTIPSVFIKAGDCANIKGFLNDELEISLVATQESGPDSLSGSFDNGIIAHEYGHGISNRLTGGPSVASCLRDYDNNSDGFPEDGEQMGEGWSDFFGLVTTVRPGDTKATIRGIAPYVARQGVNGRGIRRYPYTTDRSLNPLTYESIITESVPYGPGTVWASTLWDLYWAFVDEYGWDANMYNGTGGNNIALQLIFDALKLQPCNPSMIDGRDAILIADEVNNAGANSCLIWKVFAGRGIGYGADSGDIRFKNDTRESYELLPQCIKELKISKEVTPVIQAGENIDVTLVVTNHKESTATSLVVSDQIPDGAVYLAGSANKPVSFSGSDITFEIEELASGRTDTIRYKLSTPDNKFSTRLFFDDMESGIDNWFQIPEENTNLWEIENSFARSGTHSLGIIDIDTSSRQSVVLENALQLNAEQPILRFYHQYDTEPAADGGYIEISKDGGNNWINAEPYIFKNGYRGLLLYSTFAIPNLRAFWGPSEDFIDTYVDLSEFAGEEILIKYRFGTDNSVGGVGWFIDDVEFMDMLNYQGEACLSSGQGDQVCTVAPYKGTIVETGLTTPTREISAEGFDLQVFPNPANAVLNMNVKAIENGPAQVTLFSLEGRALLQQDLQLTAVQQLIPIDISGIPAGFYIVRLSGGNEVAVRKVIIE